MTNLHNYYEQGRQAFLTAGLEASCPHRKHSQEYLEWSRGLVDAWTADGLMPEGHPV